MFDHLLGNPVAKRHLQRLCDTKAVPQVMLFHGPEGVGKGAFAEQVALFLSHPVDIHVFRPEGKTFQHPIASMRALIQEAALPPFQAPYKVFILHDTEKMLPVSSNALLKTLEEPHPHTHFILTTSRLHEILPTIVSRCQKIPFFPIPEAEIAQYTGDSYAALLSEGSLGKAVYLSKKSQRHLVEELFRAHAYPAFAQALAQMEEPDEEEDRLSHADRIFEEILYYIRAHFPLQLEKSIPRISQARLALFHHVKLKTVLEEFFLN